MLNVKNKSFKHKFDGLPECLIITESQRYKRKHPFQTRLGHQIDYSLLKTIYKNELTTNNIRITLLKLG